VTLTPSVLSNYLSDQLGIDTAGITDDTPLFSSGLIDSFSMLDLVVFIEKNAGFRIKPTEMTMDNLDSIAKMLAFVRTKTGARS
jgi:acyl carrier protein